MSPSSTAIVVAQEHPQWPVLAKALDQRLPSIKSFLGGNEQAADRFRRVVLQSIVRNPDLLNASVESLTSAAAEAAQLGLEPSGAIGGAYIVRYGDKAQLLIDFRGLIELARRSEQIEDVFADAVREKDHFAARKGLMPDLEHEPDYTADRSPNPDTEGNRVTHVYAVALFRSGHRRFEVMSRAEVDAIRSRSRAANNGPWVTDYVQMALKTVTRRLCKTLPLHVQAREVIAADEEREYGGSTPRVTVEEPSRTGSLADRLARRRIGLGDTEQPAAMAGGEDAPASDGEAAARVASPTETPFQQGSPAQPPESVAGSATAQADRSSPAPAPSGQEATSAAGLDSEPQEAPPVPPRTTLEALRAQPSTETFTAFALEVLGMEPDVSLGDLTEAEFGQVIADAVDSEEEWEALFRRLPSVVKAYIRGKGHAPADRRKRAAEKPDAEQMRAALGGDSE